MAPIYTSDEVALLKAHYPDLKQLRKLLPHRSTGSLKFKAHQLGFAKAAWPDWSLEEEKTISKLYPDTEAILVLLPHRTRLAIVARYSHMGIQRPNRLWSPERRALLEALSGQTSDRETAEMLGGSVKSIEGARRRFGLRKAASNPGTIAVPLVGDIFQVADRRGLRLGKISKALGCVKLRRSVPEAKLNISSAVRVVKALGGELYVEWPDD